MAETAVTASAPPAATTTQQIVNEAANATTKSSLLSSSRDLLTLPFRAIYRADTFALSTLPRQVAKLVGLEGMTSHFLDGSSATVAGEAAVAAGSQTTAGGGTMGPAAAAAAAQESGFRIADLFYTLRKLSGFFAYLTSRWSMACFTAALILNRISIYASTRRHIHLQWDGRLALRIIPMLLLANQICTLLRAMRCQTSPAYSSVWSLTPTPGEPWENSGGGGFLYSMSSVLLSWESDQQSCSAVNMGAPANASGPSRGSFALLWPVFLRLCVSQFVEMLSCSLQGRPVPTETGMSTFEHSLAFAEAESQISQVFGLGLFAPVKKGQETKSAAAENTLVLTKAQVLERMNVTPELLLIALLSCCNSFTSHLLDVFGKQSWYRLHHTAFWGVCFMAAMVYGLLGGPSLNNEATVLTFPTVCIVGFVPHLLLLCGITSCMVIYTISLLITAFSLPLESPRPGSLRERLRLAHDNMQGASQIQSIRLNRHEDFYTALLRIGYLSLTAASEAVFLNEGESVVARQTTWLEEDRLAEIEASRGEPVRTGNVGERRFDNTNVKFEIPQRPPEWVSGYGREKKIEKNKNGTRASRSPTDPGGVGAFRGANRAYHVLTFFQAIFSLLAQWAAYGVSLLLDRMGIQARPQWLKRMVGARRRNPLTKDEGSTDPLDFWILTDEGGLELPVDNEFDVETEMRKREYSNAVEWGQPDERRLDEKLYDWWRLGGSWGNQDQSEDYWPPEEDFDDTTSVLSMSTNATDSEWEDDESGGRRTPTQADPFPDRFPREGTPQPDVLMDIRSFARLLDPRDQASREEARILAAHLSADQGGRILTRRQYQQEMEREKARVVLSARYPQLAAQQPDNDKRRPTPEEESELLESLILARRVKTLSGMESDNQTWENGASGLGPDGPPCVVCHSSPRSIIAWPCRCLCVCDECRSSLALNNFGSCVTCRQEVAGFMRLWVP